MIIEEKKNIYEIIKVGVSVEIQVLDTCTNTDVLVCFH